MFIYNQNILNILCSLWFYQISTTNANALASFVPLLVLAYKIPQFYAENKISYISITNTDTLYFNLGIQIRILHVAFQETADFFKTAIVKPTPFSSKKIDFTDAKETYYRYAKPMETNFSNEYPYFQSHIIPNFIYVYCPDFNFDQENFKFIQFYVLFKILCLFTSSNKVTKIHTSDLTFQTKIPILYFLLPTLNPHTINTFYYDGT